LNQRQHFKEIEEYERLLSVEYMKSFSRVSNNDLLGIDSLYLL
jgi:hypothetical protein